MLNIPTKYYTFSGWAQEIWVPLPRIWMFNVIRRVAPPEQPLAGWYHASHAPVNNSGLLELTSSVMYIFRGFSGFLSALLHIFLSAQPRIKMARLFQNWRQHHFRSQYLRTILDPENRDAYDCPSEFAYPKFGNWIHWGSLWHHWFSVCPFDSQIGNFTTLKVKTQPLFFYLWLNMAQPLSYAKFCGGIRICTLFHAFLSERRLRLRFHKIGS